MIGHPAWQGMKSGLWIGIFLFLASGIGAQAAPVVSSFKINNGAVSTLNPAVTLPNVCDGATSATHSYMASESPDFAGVAWKPYAPVPLFILSNTTSGTKTVYFKVKDSSNAESAVTSDTITLGGEGYSIVVWGQTQYSPSVPPLNSGFVTIAAGWSHNVALRSDGSIAAWLVNSDAYSWGQSDVPEPNNGFVAVSAGGLHSLGLKSDGSIIAWGYNENGRCTVPTPNIGFVAIAAGGEHSLGLKSNGSVLAWGANTDSTSGLYTGPCDVPVPNSDFVAVAAGNYHSLGLKSNGSVVAWGKNNLGQCDVPSPNSGFVAIAAGTNHSLGLKSDGSVVAWGSNTDWEGDYMGQCDVPAPNSGFLALAAGGFHSLGLKADGSITAWGSNVDDWNDHTGQCDVPAPNRNFMAVAGGGNHSLALAVNGNLQVIPNPSEAIAAGAQWRLTSESVGIWHNSGDIVMARIGSHTLTFKDVIGWVKPEDQPVEVVTSRTIVANGTYDRLYLTLSTPCNNGTIQTSPAGPRFPYGTTLTLTAQPNPGYWFDHWTGAVPTSYEQINPLFITLNENTTVGATFVAGPPPAAPVISAFEINDGTTTTANPVVTLSTTCTAVTSGSAVQCMVSESSDFAGATWWPYSQSRLYLLSQGTGEKTVYYKVRTSAGVESAAASDSLTVVASKGFPLVTWGGVLLPIPVKEPNRGFTAISRFRSGGGERGTLALKSDGSIVTWGTSGPSPNTDFVAISAGSNYGLGLKSDGSVAAWGNNVYGQCDVPLPNRDFVAVVAGSDCSLGIKSDSSIVAWGSHQSGLCDIPAPNRDFVAVSMGVSQCLGIKSDGSIVSWGRYAIAPPTLNKDFKAVVGGYLNGLALKSDGSILRYKSGRGWAPCFTEKGFVAIAAGEQINLGLKSDGSIVMFDEWYTYKSIPSPNTDFVAIAAGGSDFLALANEGDLRVTVTPPEAVAESDARRQLSEMAGQWRLAYEKATVWHRSGDVIRLRGKQTITFRDIYGWIKPADQVVEADLSTTVTVTAQYTPVTWTLSTTCGANGSLQQSPAGTQFPHGATVTLTAQPAAGSWFDRWTGDVPAGLERVNPLILTMDANKTIGADFDASAIPSAPVISSFRINNGATTTVNPAVILTNVCTGETSASAAQYLASEFRDFAGATWRPYGSVPLFTVSGGEGEKTVYLKVKNSAEVESAVTSDTISLVGAGASVIVWGGNSHGQGGEPPDNVNFVAISAGDKHNLGLKSDGSIVAWGGNYAKQCSVPAPNRDFVAIAAGYTHSLGLKSDGSVVAWGENGWGQCLVPLPNRDFVAVSAGFYFSLGLKSDGSVVAWGRNDYGQCTVPISIGRCVAISAGAYHCLALKANGSIAAWGNNNDQQCDLPLANRNFVAISAVGNYGFALKPDGSMVAMGSRFSDLHLIPTPNLNYTMASVGKGGHCLGLKPDGSIIAWGSNGCGQCNVPAPNIYYLDVSAGGGHSLALAVEGNLRVTLTPPSAIAAGAQWRLTGETEGVWHNSGETIRTQAGSHTLTFKDLYKWFKPADQAVNLVANGDTSATGNYNLIVWTLTTVCGDGTILVSPSGNRFTHDTTVTLTARPDSGYWFDHWTGDVPKGLERVNPLVLTMNADKTIGADLDSGPLPPAPVIAAFKINNGAVLTASPAVTLPNTCASETSASATHYMASESADFAGGQWKPYGTIPLFLLSGEQGIKTVYFKVKNSAEQESSVTSDTIQLGGPGFPIVAWGWNDYGQCTAPTPNMGFLSVSGRYIHSMGLKSDGSILLWGNNWGDSHGVPSPNSGFVSIAAGLGHDMGLKSDGSIVVWGDNDSGLCTVPAPNRNFAAISAGDFHCLGLKSDGSIMAWGSTISGYDKGQFDVPSPNNGFVAVATGGYHSLGLKSDGSIVAWGWNDYGQCNVPSPNSGFVAIAAGERHSLGLKSDGSIVAWGSNQNQYLETIGQCAVPVPNRDFVALAAGDYHSLGLKSDGSIVAWGENKIGECNVPALSSDLMCIAAGGSHSLALLRDEGFVRTTIAPSAAVAAGARWRMAGENIWHESGSSITWPVGTFTVELLDDLAGWYAQPTTQTVTIAKNKLTSITGTYAPGQTWSLSVTAENGAVIKSPSKTNYRAGETARLTAIPAVGYHFTGWSGSVSGTTNPLTLTMDSSKTLAAHFAINEYALTVQAANGSVTRAPEQATYSHGTTVSLTAIPDKDFRFDHWTGDVPAGLELANPLNLIMNGPKAIQPIFEGQIVPEVSSFKINNGAPTAVNPTVTLPNVCAGATSATHAYMASESADFTSATWKPYASVPLFALSPVAGTKTVYLKIRDDQSDTVTVTSDTIVLDSPSSVVAWGNDGLGQCDVPAPNQGFVALSNGLFHGLGLTSDGSIRAWGSNGWEVCTLPSPNRDFVAIASGDVHNLALKSDGSVVAWGSNDYGQSNVPLPNRDFVAVADGYHHCLGLKSDGSIIAWGANSDWQGNYMGQSAVPYPNAGFVAVSAGKLHSLGLKSGGSIVAWGSNAQGQCNVPTPNSDFIAIAAEENFSLGLKSDGSIVAWGENADSQCNIPPPNSGFVAIAAGIRHGLGLKSDGSIRAWGSNSFGQTAVPEPNAGFMAISAGGSNSFAIASGGMGRLKVTLTPPESVAAGAQWRLTSETAGIWHNSGDVVRARGNTTQTLTFKSVYGWNTPPDQAVYLANDDTVPGTGEYRRVNWALSAVCENGSVEVSPSGSSFPHGTVVQLTARPGQGYWFDRWTGDVPAGLEQANPLTLTMDANKVIGATMEPFPAFPEVSNFSINNGAATTLNPTVILSNNCRSASSATHSYMASESADFTSATWKPYAALSLFTLSRSNGIKTIYYKVKDGANVESAVTSDTITLGDIGYFAVAWGTNDHFQCRVPGLNGDFSSVVAGRFHSLGLKSDGSVLVWGQNDYGQAITPAPNKEFTAVAAGWNHNLGLKSDGSIFAWGYNADGQCRVPAPNSGFVGLASGANHSVGLKSDGSVVVWGSNFAGQRDIPVPNSGFVAVSAGYGHSLGLKSDGSIVAWGYNDYGQCSVPEPNRGFVAVMAGGNHSLGLRADGSIAAWGDNRDAQCQIPLPNSGFVAVAAGGDTSLALKADGSIVTLGAYGEGQNAVPAPNSGYMAIAAGGLHSFALASQGALQVKLAPPEAIAAGARWRLTDEVNKDIWHDETVYDPVTQTSGTLLKSRIGSHTVTFDDIAGWVTPPDRQVELTTTETTVAQGEYKRIYCSLWTQCSNGSVQMAPVGPSFPYGTTVTLTAKPADGYHFTGWSGAVISTDNPLNVVMDSTKTLTANFEENVVIEEFALTVDVVGRGSVTKLPDQTAYVGGMIVTLTATPAPGYYFVGWSGAITGQFSPVNVIMDSTKTLTATFAANEYALTVEATNGTVTKSPDQATYAHGTTVTLTAVPAAGYQFTGWAGSTTSTLNPLALVMDSTKSLTAKFESVAPTSLTAVGNTYRVLVSWAPVTSVTSFVVTRTAGDDVTSWTVGAVSSFADDTALPGVTYAYTVAALDAQGAAGTPSDAVTASVTAETFVAAVYKVTAKGYVMTRDLPTTGGLTFTLTGTKAGTIKIAALKKLPANAVDNAAKGIYYLPNQGQVSTLAINGDVKTLAFDVPVYLLEVTGEVKSVTAKSVTFLKAASFEKVTIAATKDSGAGLYARTFIETAGTSQVPMLIKVTGAVVEEVGSTGVAAQPVKLLNVASKVYRDAAKAKKMSLGAVGSLPKVVAEISNTPVPQSEATPCSIQGQALKAVTVSAGPIVADEFVGAIDKVTVSGGNLRAGLIQSSKNITLIQATSKRVNGATVGGAVGTTDKAPAMVVKAQPPVTGKNKTALTKVYGQKGVSGYFYAGYDALFQKGGIGILQTAKGGVVEGAAFLDPTLAAKMKVLPDGQPIAVNPAM
jgi:alpha-tubulin suppressor-like RCC1 family protein